LEVVRRTYASTEIIAEMMRNQATKKGANRFGKLGLVATPTRKAPTRLIAADRIRISGKAAYGAGMMRVQFRHVILPRICFQGPCLEKAGIHA
jgi:hypothetical protein